MFLHTSVGKTNAFLWNECRTNVLIIQHLGRISGRRDLISVLSSVFEINVTTPSLEVAESLAYKTSQFILAMCDTHSEASNLMAVPGPSSSSFLLHMPPPTLPPLSHDECVCVSVCVYPPPCPCALLDCPPETTGILMN